jgi:thermitase
LTIPLILVYDNSGNIIQKNDKMLLFLRRSRIVSITLILFSLFLIIWNMSAIPSTPSSNSIGTRTSTASSTDTSPVGTAPKTNLSTETTEKSTASSEAFQEPSTSKPTTTPIPATKLSGNFAPDEVLIKFDPSTLKNDIEKCLESADATLESQIEEIDVIQVKVPTGKVAESIASLSVCNGILYAEPDYIARMTDTIPTDPGWGSQYGLIAIHAPQGWDMDKGSSAVTIAIVDTGIDLGHVDLAGKIVPGYDFVNNDTIPQDDNGHGTRVAGMAGVSWGARIMPVKVLNASGNGFFADVAAGIIWAADNGAEVINLSLGGLDPSSVLEDAINYAYGKDATLVAAVGNSGSNFVLYPARYPHVIAVAATDSSNNHAPFSNFGPEVDVSAPGVMIYSTAIGNTYSYISGTSASTPFVSGLAAILRGFPTYISPDQITGDLETTALDLGISGRDDLYGYGLIQMEAAIQLDWPTPTPTATPTATSTATFTPTATYPVNTPTAVLVLPATGFTPNRTTILPAQPAVKAYADLGDMWLEIPRLEVELPIVGVPQVGNGWDVSWLGDQAGWLNGTAFPTNAGNSALSAHVYDAYGRPGPFVHLNTMLWGDQIIVHAFGQEYVYAVRESELVAPGAVSSVIRHEENPWLTLITCQDYDEVSDSYRTRVVVRAVQVAIK